MIPPYAAVDGAYRFLAARYGFSRGLTKASVRAALDEARDLATVERDEPAALFFALARTSPGTARSLSWTPPPPANRVKSPGSTSRHAPLLSRPQETALEPMTRASLPAALVPAEYKILLLRGERVMLDADLAVLYGVETRSLVRAVKRNAARFPPDFMFQLTADEVAHLRSQTGISSATHGGRRYSPYAFTEHGVAMLSAVLRSQRAVDVSIEIVRAFVRLRTLLAGHADLARKLAALEKRYDAQFRVVFDAIRELMAPPSKRQRPIGFRP